MIRAFTMAFYQIGNKSLRRVIWMALIGSIALFVFLWLVVGFVLFKIEIFAFDGFLGFFNTIFEWVVNIFGASAVVVISWLLFLADGNNDLVTIAERTGIAYSDLLRVVHLLVEKTVIQPVAKN